MPDFLLPTAFIDSAAPNIVAFARQAAGDESDEVTRAVRLYYAVRDGIVYTPYCDFRSLDTFRASAVLARGDGFCVGKAAVLAAVARASGIPARVGFADVRNHLCTPRLRALVGGDVFYYQNSLFHAYDRGGRRHMEYLRDHGAHADVPVDEIVATFAREYPRLMESSPRASDTQFRREAEESA